VQAEPESVRRLVESLTGEALKQFLNNLRNHVECSDALRRAS
jgi:hypothetical protein